MTENPRHDHIVKILNERFYEKPLIDNVYRGDYVETLILSALGEGWKSVGGWGSWDLENEAGVRLEVKQSAALQPWHQQTGSSKNARFDIAPRTGYYADKATATEWVDSPEGERVRSADIYVFAWHPKEHRDTADHREAEQWEFFVVSALRLPDSQKTIGLNPLRKLTTAVPYAQLAAKVEEIADGLPYRKAEIGQFRGQTSGTLVPQITEQTAEAATNPRRRAGSGSRSRFTPETFIETFPEEQIRQAITCLFDVARQNGSRLEGMTGGVSIRARCPASNTPLAVAWLYTPATAGWMGAEGFIFGHGNGYKNYFDGLSPLLREKLDGWVDQFSQDSFASEVTGTGYRAYAISHVDAADAANIDLLAGRLERVLGELRELPAGD